MINSLIRFFSGNEIDWYASRVWPFIRPNLFMEDRGYSSIIYYSTIRGFNTEYYEAARIDGATWFQQIRYITIPMLKSIAIIMFIIRWIDILFRFWAVLFST